MTSLLANRAARRRGIAFAALLVISTLMMAFSSNPAVREVQNGVSFAFRPIQGAVHDAAAGIASVAGAITEIDRLRVDNAALLAENQRLKVENARTEEIRRENELLTGLLQLRAGIDYQTVAATVIARESSEFRRLVVLDRGTNDGIAVGDVAVVAGLALAGRVTEVGPDSAKVVLLSDGEFKVIGQLTTTAATGEVIGQLGAGVLVMRQIDSSEVVTVGDEVVTAGIELGGGVRSPYPKGLVLGQVIDVRRDANDVVQTAYLQPAADLDKLEFVLVITDYQGGLPPIEQQPIDCNQPDGTLPQGEQPCFDPAASPSPSVSP
ncbi:MAG TPA: rod shape-determining protein MreC [Candidatus Limnocylindrales bacterium]|nr:rod shape-determining protein MreC [Candidatus Limnocylindrales bacterium]